MRDLLYDGRSCRLISIKPSLSARLRMSSHLRLTGMRAPPGHQSLGGGSCGRSRCGRVMTGFGAATGRDAFRGRAARAVACASFPALLSDAMRAARNPGGRVTLNTLTRDLM